MRDWHRIFGMSVAVTVMGRPFRVIQELELSQIRQRLDVALLQMLDSDQPESWPDLPDGLTVLARHNLISFKSMRESFTVGAMLELISHSVTYAKPEWNDSWEQHALRPGSLLPLAVSTQRPRWLSPEQRSGQRQVLPGVFEVDFQDLTVRVIVPREVTKCPRNAIWHLLSGNAELVAYGLKHCDAGNSMLYNVMNDLRETYSLEGVEMPYTIEDYRRETTRENLAALSEDELTDVLKDLPYEQLLKLVPIDERIKDVPIGERIKDVPIDERIKDIPLDERIKDIPVERIEAWLAAKREGGKSNDGSESAQ